MKNSDVKIRSGRTRQKSYRAVRKGLLTLHTLELMAVNIYKYQVTGSDDELNRQLISAMCNEMTHMQDFQVKLYEYGWKPSRFRWAYWMAGFVIGRVSRIFGGKAILKTGIWIETKAVNHYAELLDTVNWDEGTRGIIEKNQFDEYGHIDQWKRQLDSAGMN